jgi:hypothetical protein
LAERERERRHDGRFALGKKEKKRKEKKGVGRRDAE